MADRQHDYENFMATLLMTKAIRSPALVVRAFNVEIARIQDQTTDAQTAAFRLQFWQDALKEIYTNRQHDYENFMATLLMTKAIRSPALVVRAFNVEIARIQDQTTDAQTAAFRLQFWQDALKEIYTSEQSLQNIPANPIAQELFKICCCYNLPRRHLERLISSRSSLLKTKYFRTLEDVERYSDETVSSIYYLILKVAGVENVNADHVASHLGKAQGISNTLRSIRISNHHKMVSLPMDTLMKNHVSQEMVLRGVDSDSMRSVAFEVASRAN
ncbi:putative squalene/phytoene synthase, partial [Operophtera brumata]